MLYLKVEWIHEVEEDPVLLYSEVDTDGYEVRKVEIFRDGRMTYADVNDSTGDTRLGEGKLPSFGEIQEQGEFRPDVIGSADFDRVWAEAHR